MGSRLARFVATLVLGGFLVAATLVSTTYDLSEGERAASLALLLIGWAWWVSDGLDANRLFGRDDNPSP